MTGRATESSTTRLSIYTILAMEEQALEDNPISMLSSRSLAGCCIVMNVSPRALTLSFWHACIQRWPPGTSHQCYLLQLHAPWSLSSLSSSTTCTASQENKHTNKQRRMKTKRERNVLWQRKRNRRQDKAQTNLHDKICCSSWVWDFIFFCCWHFDRFGHIATAGTLDIEREISSRRQSNSGNAFVFTLQLKNEFHHS